MPWPDLPKRVHSSLKILCSLAKAGRPLQAGRIAHLQHIPPARAAKILQLLTWAGFVRSRRGMNGGYWLEVPADRIRIGDVLTFFDSRSPARKPKSDDITKALRKVTDSVRKTFEQLTIASLSEFATTGRTREGGGR